MIAAVNTVIAAAYYMQVMREMWMKPVPDGDVTPIAHAAAGLRPRSASRAAGTIVFGVLPGLVMPVRRPAPTSPAPSAG